MSNNSELNFTRTVKKDQGVSDFSLFSIGKSSS